MPLAASATAAGCRAEVHVSSSELEWTRGAVRSSSSFSSCQPGRTNFESSFSSQCRYPRSEPGWRMRWRRKGRAVAGAMLDRSNAVAQESFGSTTSTSSVEEELADVNLEEAQWTSSDSEALYRVQGWGSPYFFVSPQGHVCVRLFGLPDGPVEVDLVELIESLKTKNVQLPLAIRFPNILNHRMMLLQDSFNAAILIYGYKSHFQGVFPVKCNHDRFLVEEVVGFGKQYQFGLEAGSKPELLIAMANLRKSRSALLICNGYKAY